MIFNKLIDLTFDRNRKPSQSTSNPADKLVDLNISQESPIPVSGTKLIFSGVPDNRDVYNITAPFSFEGRQYLAGRVESRNAHDSISGFFRRTQPGHYNFCSEFPFYQLEDPFFTWIGHEFVFGGVEIEKVGNETAYRTVFYRGQGPNSLSDIPFAKGPEYMKDIRIKMLPDGHIVVFTRPQGEIGGKGKIGITLIDSLDELRPEIIDNATLIFTGLTDDNWGGVNEIHVLDDQWLGLLSHKAKFFECNDETRDLIEGSGSADTMCRSYTATVFKYNWKTGQVTPMVAVAERQHFPEGPSKRPDLENVVFAGGLIRRDDGNAELYCGLSDTEAGYVVINDPFL